MTATAADLNLPPLSSPAELARLVGYSETRIRRCIRATETVGGWPPLPAKRMPDGQLRVTAEAAAEWINALKDA